MEWPSRPFVRLLIFLITGIFLAGLLPDTVKLPDSIIYILCGVILVSVILLAIYFKSFRFRWLAGLFFGITIVVTGMVLTIEKRAKAKVSIDSSNRYWRAEVASDPVFKEKSVKLVAVMKPLIKNKNSATGESFKAALVFELDSLSRTLIPGEILYVNTKMKVPSGAQNPGAFDYKKFLNDRGITYTAFVPSHHWKKTGETSHGILYGALKLRQLLLKVLNKNGLSGKEYAVTSAVLLGYDRLMDEKTEHAYSAAGAIHVLCVSGLHVGIIYLVFGFLLSFINNRGRFRWLKAVLLLAVIWFYAFLTGLSPSVWRASVMISLFIIGENLNRDKDKYNTLAASAFILLIINPLLLYNIGFQLSYAAVSGILLMYQPLYGILYFKNKFLNLIWSVTALSLSAQAGAFPVAAHYFHTFPVYFLLTNLVVFGLAYIVVTLGMLFLVLSPVSWLAFYIGKALYGTVYLMNFLTESIASLPYAQLTGLYYPWIKVVLVYGILLGIFFWLVLRKTSRFIPLLAFIFLLLLFDTTVKYDRLKRKEIVVYRLSKGVALDLVWGGKNLFLADSVSVNRPKGLMYAAKNYHISNGLSNQVHSLETAVHNSSGIFYRSGFFMADTVSGLILNKKQYVFPPLKKKMNIDYLIISTTFGNPLKDILRSVNFKNVVIANGTGRTYREKIKKEASQLHVPLYDMKKQGYFSVEW